MAPFLGPSVTPGQYMHFCIDTVHIHNNHFFVDTPWDWNYTTTAQPGLDNRSYPYPRGRLLGGSSSASMSRLHFSSAIFYGASQIILFINTALMKTGTGSPMSAAIRDGRGVTWPSTSGGYAAQKSLKSISQFTPVYLLSSTRSSFSLSMATTLQMNTSRPSTLTLGSCQSVCRSPTKQ